MSDRDDEFREGMKSLGLDEVSRQRADKSMARENNALCQQGSLNVLSAIWRIRQAPSGE